jgi:hypothetical protein
MKALCVLLALGALWGAPAAHAEPTPAREYLASIRPSPELQSVLDQLLDARRAVDPTLRRADVRIALLDLTPGEAPRLAQHQGDIPIYPASVVKFAYLMPPMRGRSRASCASTRSSTRSSPT